METRPKLTLEEELEPILNAKNAPLWRRLAGLLFVAAVLAVGYTYRDLALGLINKKAGTVTADSGGAPAEGRGSRGGGRGGGTAVTAVAARTVDMPIYLRGLGSVTPFNSVTVKTRIDGQLTSVAFTEGQAVRTGDALAEIDRRPYEVQLAQAQSQLAQAQGQRAQAVGQRAQTEGQLARDMAQLESARAEVARNQLLLDRGLIPRQQADLQNATLGQFEGSIQADRAAITMADASIKVADAAIDLASSAIANANLQINYTKIAAPISGRIGLRLVDPGNLVRATDPNGLAVIAQLQPIVVLFNIPEDNLDSILKKLRAGEKLRVEAYDRDDQIKVATGTLLTVDNQIDPSTGTSRLKAVFDNADNALFPNQFVNVHLLVETLRGATVVPAAAVQRGPQGTYVYVVGDDKKVSIRPVTIKNTEGSDVSIGGEVRPGELVVVEGTDKIQDGARVDAQTPAPDSAAGATPAPNAPRGEPGERGERGNGRGGGRRGGRGGAR